MVWGVSSSDVTNCGWNTAVGFGVLAACAGTALAVRMLAGAAINSSKTMNEKEQDTYRQYAQYAGVALGLAVAGAAYKFIPNSRFALITDDSNGKMLKLGVLQTVFGAFIDYFVSKDCPTGAVVGLGGALATRCGNLVLPALGVVGAGLGSGYI